MEPNKAIFFNDKEYRLMGSGKYYLSQSTKNEERKKAKGLHVAIWEFHNGREVPSDHHIHHKDGNTFNNDISNLECVLSKVHLSEHSKMNFNNVEYKERNREHLNKVRELSKEWHRSEEGSEWHREHYAKTLGLVEKTEKKCVQCEKSIYTRKKEVKFCSDKCGENWRRKHQRYEYTGICIMCGDTFQATKAKPSAKGRETCGKTCQNRLNYRNRKEKESSENTMA